VAVPISFSLWQDGTAIVRADVWNVRDRATRLEVLRGGVPIARSDTRGGPGPMHDLQLRILPGDVATVFVDGVATASATYDGTPAVLGKVCAGSTSWQATRNPGASVLAVGIDSFNPNPYIRGLRVAWTLDPFVFTTRRPLVAGQMVHFTTRLDTPGGGLISQAHAFVVACTPPAVAPSDAQVLASVKLALATTGKQLRSLKLRKLARKKQVSLAFGYPEAGTTRLELTTKVKKKTKVLGKGSRKRPKAGKANVTVKLTASARKLLKRSKHLKVTLKATFTPSRAGAKTQRASVTVMVKR
jgi:hypothetical protein